MGFHHCLAGLKWALLILPLFCLIDLPAAHAACTGEDGGTGLVTELHEGETLILEDGRAIRLMGVLTPKRARGAGPASEARTAMEKTLAALTVGKKISLQQDGRKRDRYGRLLAHVFAEIDGERVWVQEKLIAAGMARVISFPDNRLCIRQLLETESHARQEPRGLWKTGYFAVRPAAAEDLLYRLAQNYEIIEGQVENVAEVKGRTYINFGQNWRRDFTILIAAKDAKSFQDDGAAEHVLPAKLADLGGRNIRVRGWIKKYNGPSVSVTHPEQIEILEDRDGALDQEDRQP